MPRSLEERVLERIEPDAIAALASDLIRIPSFKTQETPVALWLRDFFGSRDYDVELQEVDPGRFQTVAILRGRGSGSSLMFNGHIDIDPLADGWRRDPWTPILEGGMLYGAGLNNMKGGLACMISAAECIRQEGMGLHGDLVLACVVGELEGGVGTVHLLNSGLRTDMAVVPEPFGAHNAITTHAGLTQLAVSTIGFSRHVGDKATAIDAIAKMLKVIPALTSMTFRCSPRPDLPALPMLSVGCIIGGRGRDHVLTGPNFVSDYCTVLVDVRFLPSQTQESVREDIERVLTTIKKDDPEFQYEIEQPPGPQYRALRLSMEPFEISIDSEIVQSVASQYTRITHRAPHVGIHIPYSYGAEDCCHLWRAGIPVVLYGPEGRPPRPDFPDDCMALDEMALATRVLALTAVDICGVGPN